ncbi:regulator of (H+)-ATPase in vacuolar membrane [Lobaria immixta]|nr:regulator of (H+)-ATPase in vacuolar membrane [Lobaria immixta]
MRVVLPGKPQAKLQAVCTAQWEGQRIVAYASGNALIILGGPHDLIQTIYHDGSPALDAVAIDNSTGKIATCDSEEVYIYRPYGRKEGALRWSLQCTIRKPDETGGILTLSWGSDGELLVGSLSLRLFQTAEEAAMIWSRQLSRPAKFASFSPDASLIASTGLYDRLIKLWRRQSFGADDTRFDFTYLPHPKTVTSVHWRKPHDREQSTDNVLYSICADHKVRIWATTNPHGLQVLQLWAEIDMQESIQPRQIQSTSQLNERYAFIIDSHDFTFATERAMQAASDGNAEENHALEHLIEIAKRIPEVCVVLDGRGNMSAWGLESIGCKTKKPANKFNIAHVENFSLSKLQAVNAGESNLQFLNFCSHETNSAFTVLVHHFDGRIEWLEGRVDELFDPSPRRNRLQTKALWTGHDGSVKKIIRNRSGTALLSRTNDNEGLLWKQKASQNGMTLTRYSSLSCVEHIHRTCLLDEGDFVVNLHHHSISVWDMRASVASQTASINFEMEGKLLCLLLLREPDRLSSSFYVAAITSRMRGIVWEIQSKSTNHWSSESGKRSGTTITQFCSFDLKVQEDLRFILPVDPAGSPSITSSFLDTFAKDIAISYTKSGVLCAWAALIEVEKSSVEWVVTSRVETGIQDPSLASGSSIRKTAIIDAARTGLTIWDASSGQLEYDVHYEAQDLVQDLDWSSTPDDQSILAVGFPHKVVILSQMRFDYINTGPAWAPIRQILIRESTPHPIGDSTWLGSGNLVIGSGNQLYVYDQNVSISDDFSTDLSIPVHTHRSMTIFDLATYLNGPLPVFHPQFLAQCMLAGKLVQVQKIIIGLHKALKFFSDGDELDSFVSLPIDSFFAEPQSLPSAAKKEMRSSYADFVEESEPETVTEDLAASLNENLAKLAVPQLSSREQILLADIIECVATAEKHRRSMDDNAMRYLLFFRQHMLRKGQAPASRVGITWREIVWAYHSNSQDMLVHLVSKQFQGKMLWKHARESGMFMWMADLSALRAQFEVIARNEYTKTDEKNPIDCSLYYLALKKKNVLMGLWRMASWNREQSSTQKLLSNNFQEPRWKTAALKNAYALLGKRRFEYAAAFFLLAGNLHDAVNVCAHQLQDLQLAVAIARVYEGDDGLVLRSLLEDKVLPQTALEGNRWLATLTFWMLGRRDMAVRVLISPVYTLLDSPETPNLQSRSYLANDPALIVLYKQLREKTLQTLQGASKISPRAEWEFVIQIARLYDRMGCDLLALDLVRNWEFLVQPRELPRERSRKASVPDLRKMLRRRSSLVVDDLPSPGSPNQPRGLKAPPQKVFEEPDSNSLLDNFGF